MSGASAGSAIKGATTSRILNKLSYALANDATDIATAATGDLIPMIDISADYELKFGDAANLAQIMGTTQADQTKLNAIASSAAEIDAAADVSARLVSIADATTYAVLAANSGKPHVLPNLTSSCTLTLPTPASGLEYEFYYKGVAADAQNWVIDTGSNTNYYVGGLVHLDTDAGAAGDEIVPIAGDGNSNSKLTVVTPDVGTRVKAICDGTLWILSGFVASATVPSFAD